MAHMDSPDIKLVHGVKNLKVGAFFLVWPTLPASNLFVNNTPVLFEFAFNSNDSLKTKITNTEINKYELKLK